MIGCALVWIDKWFQVVDVAQLEIIARQATATQIIIKPNSFIHCTNTDIYEFTQRRHYLCCRHNTSLLFFEQFSYLLKSIMFRFKYGNAFMAKINGNIAPGLRLCKVFLCRTSFFFRFTLSCFVSLFRSIQLLLFLNHNFFLRYVLFSIYCAVHKSVS